MIKIQLIRKQASNIGTKGRLICKAPELLLYTMENPWLDNKPRESCIPTGIYDCEIVQSPRFGRVYGVTNVKDRSHILFHAGNYPRDTRGCILIGQTGDFLSDTMFIGNSQKALKEFMDKLDGKPFELEIINEKDIDTTTSASSVSPS